MKAYCIYGPPGTGKTTELVRMLKWVLKEATHERTVFVSHTRAAAAEAVSRLTDVSIPREQVSTIHSLCYRLCDIGQAQVVTPDRLREFGRTVNVPVTGRSPDGEEELQVGDEMLGILSLARCLMADADQVYENSDRPGDHALFSFFADAYRKWKDANGYIDFNDMLERFLATDLSVPYESFVIDEAQDLSPLQWAVLRKLIRRARYVVFAGDDDQSIYGWGGADPRGMVTFEAEIHAKRKILDQSYRVPRQVHALAHRIIAKVGDRVDKPYKARDAEGVIERVPHFTPRQMTPGTLCLYRNHAWRPRFEDELHRYGVPYVSEGGRPAPLQTKWGKAWLSFRLKELKLQASTLRPMLRSDPLRLLLDTDPGMLLEHHWQHALGMPNFYVPYFEQLDKRKSLEPVRLSSIHAAKGHEADHVVIDTSMTARTLRGNEDDEARVWYVGVTRAKEKLTIIDGDQGYAL